MSTLRTRIAGYPFVITNNPFLTEGESEFVGFFVNSMRNAGPLPFELRTMYYGDQTLTILTAGLAAMDTYRDRLDWTVDSHTYVPADMPNCVCDQCAEAEAIFVRVHMAGRKNLI